MRRTDTRTLHTNKGCAILVGPYMGSFAVFVQSRFFELHGGSVL